MVQASPFRPIALVVEDDAMQRELAAMLLEDCEMGVVQCESAEAALKVLVRLRPIGVNDAHRRQPGWQNRWTGARAVRP